MNLTETLATNIQCVLIYNLNKTFFEILKMDFCCYGNKVLVSKINKTGCTKEVLSVIVGFFVLFVWKNVPLSLF